MEKEIQIIEYLKTLNIGNEADIKAILFTCHYELHVNIPTSVFQKFKPDKPCHSYNDFKNWLDNGVPVGEIIVINGITSAEVMGICKSISLNTITLAATMTSHGIITNDMEYPNRGFRIANEEQKKQIHTRLREHGFEWSKKYNKLCERYIPVPFSYIKFINEQSGITGCGIVRKITGEGEVIMFCYKVEDEPLHYSLYESLGSVKDFTFEDCNNVDRVEFDAVLSKIGKTWNTKFKRIESVGLEFAKGDPYFHINDQFSIRLTLNRERISDINRFRVGNRFKSEESCRNFERVLLEFVKKYLALVKEDRNITDELIEAILKINIT